MRFIGIDAGITTTGICILQEDGAYEPIKVSCPKKIIKSDDFIRFNWLLESVELVIGFGKENALYMIEDYAMYGKGQITRIAEFTGMLKHHIFLSQVAQLGLNCTERNHYYIFRCSPNTLKKFATGAGKGKKSLILKAVYKKWDFDTDSDDLADAFVLAKMGQMLFSYMSNLSYTSNLKYEHECMVAVLKQNKVDRKQLFS